MIAHAHANLGNVELSDHYADLDKVVKRPDCSTELVYNFLLHLGAGGKAIAQDWRSMLFDDFVPAARKELDRKSRNPMSAVETFDREMVKRFLEKEGYNYLTDKDGDFQLKFTEESGFSWVAYLNAEGEQNEIYVLQSAHASLRIFERDWERALTLCNDWNRDKRWPKAFLYARPSDPDTVTRLGTEHQIYCAEGIHQELLDELTATFIGTSYRFWETVHQELGHA